VTHVEELQDVIKKLHNVEARHIESVPVKETHKGQTVWEGVVEVFELIGHPKASKIYAWTHEKWEGEASGGSRTITVLHIHPIQSARDAVRAVIVQEFRSNAQSEA
jgi:hypothetical protein